jgi:hypothetical protein
MPYTTARDVNIRICLFFISLCFCLYLLHVFVAYIIRAHVRYTKFYESRTVPEHYSVPYTLRFTNLHLKARSRESSSVDRQIVDQRKLNKISSENLCFNRIEQLISWSKKVWLGQTLSFKYRVVYQSLSSLNPSWRVRTTYTAVDSSWTSVCFQPVGSHTCILCFILSVVFFFFIFNVLNIINFKNQPPVVWKRDAKILRTLS